MTTLTPRRENSTVLSPPSAGQRVQSVINNGTCSSAGAVGDDGAGAARRGGGAGRQQHPGLAACVGLGSLLLDRSAEVSHQHGVGTSSTLSLRRSRTRTNPARPALRHHRPGHAAGRVISYSAAAP